jgi:hypothetical protein
MISSIWREVKSSSAINIFIASFLLCFDLIQDRGGQDLSQSLERLFQVSNQGSGPVQVALPSGHFCLKRHVAQGLRPHVGRCTLDPVGLTFNQACILVTEALFQFFQLARDVFHKNTDNLFKNFFVTTQSIEQR